MAETAGPAQPFPVEAVSPCEGGKVFALLCSDTLKGGASKKVVLR